MPVYPFVTASNSFLTNQTCINSATGDDEVESLEGKLNEEIVDERLSILPLRLTGAISGVTQRKTWAFILHSLTPDMQTTKERQCMTHC